MRVRKEDTLEKIFLFLVPNDSVRLQMQSQLKAQLDEEQAQKKAKDQLTLLRERHEAILKIESDIVEVNKIFKDLTTMVHQQGK